MTQDFRIDGGLIDRTQTLTFKFNNKTLHGHQGDTLASALLANGERLVGRSFKYHRPRGIFSAGSEEPNALVQLRTGAYPQPAKTIVAHLGTTSCHSPICCHHSSALASTTKPSCGPKHSGKKSTNPSSAPARAWVTYPCWKTPINMTKVSYTVTS